MFIVQDCFFAQIRAKMCMRAGIRAYLREESTPRKILGYEHFYYSKEHTYMSTNFQLKQLKDSLKECIVTVSDDFLWYYSYILLEVEGQKAV